MAKNEASTIRSIEELKKTYEDLNTKRIQSQTQLDQAEKRLKELQAEAVEEFQTSDVEELQAKLKAMEDENEKRRSEYQALLESISDDLKQVEQESETSAKLGTSDA